MISVTLAGLRARFARMALISLAIALGVGFVSGTFSLTDAMRTALYEKAAGRADNVAAHVTFTAEAVGGGNESVEQASEAPAGPSGFTAKDVSALQKLPGVGAVQPHGFGDVQVFGPDGKAARNLGNSSLAAFVAPVDPRLSHDKLVAGKLPADRGEVLVSADLAKDQNWAPGTEIKIADRREKKRPFRIAGTVDTNADADAIGMLPADFAAMAAEAGKASWFALDVASAPGADGQQVMDAVAAALGARGAVISGAAYADELANDAIQDLEMFTLGLLLFASIALVVAAIVIYNTFTILLAQRQRELALLRCVGAGRGQVFRGVMLESAALGLLSSIFGYLFGYGLAVLGFVVIRSFGAPVGDGLAVAPSATAVFAAFAVGIGVTMASALLPARGATRIAPVTALASQPELVESRKVGRLRVLAGGFLMLAGLGTAALAAMDEKAEFAFGGGVLTLIGLLVLGPVVVAPIGRAVGWLPARLFGAPGALAAANGARNPRRMAAATNALTLGVGLVCVFLVGAESTKVSADAELNGTFPVDFIVSADYGKTLPADLTRKLEARSELDEVTPVRGGEGSLSGPGQVTSDLTGVQPDVLVRHLPAGVAKAGDLADFRDGSIVLGLHVAKAMGNPGVGSTITVKGKKGTVNARLVALVPDAFSASLGGVIVAADDHSRLFGKVAPNQLLVWNKSGVTAQSARSAVSDVIDRFPGATVKDAAAEKEQNDRVIDGMLGAVAALMALSIIIAVIGIGITLTLSVVERTRESGMLRALGLTRRQLYGTLLLEAVIMAMIAAVLGIALGVGLGVAGTYSIIPHEIARIAVPVDRVGLVVIGAAVAGVLAALLPARRSARVSPVTALAAD